MISDKGRYISVFVFILGNSLGGPSDDAGLVNSFIIYSCHRSYINYFLYDF